MLGPIQGWVGVVGPPKGKPREAGSPQPASKNAELEHN